MLTICSFFFLLFVFTQHCKLIKKKNCNFSLSVFFRLTHGHISYYREFTYFYPVLQFAIHPLLWGLSTKLTTVENFPLFMLFWPKILQRIALYSFVFRILQWLYLSPQHLLNTDGHELRCSAAQPLYNFIYIQKFKLIFIFVLCLLYENEQKSYSTSHNRFVTMGAEA